MENGNLEVGVHVGEMRKGEGGYQQDGEGQHWCGGGGGGDGEWEHGWV
jgi:hypothetical protein